MPNNRRDFNYGQIRQRLLDIYAEAQNPSRMPEPQGEPRPITIDRIQAVADDAGFDESWFSEFTRKEIGTLAERGFEFVAGKRRIATAEPHGENLPFDLIAIIRQNRYKLYKIQVRCTAYHVGATYKVNLLHCRGDYEKGDFDFFVAWIVPEDAWYIIPFNKLPIGQTFISLHPHGKVRGGFGPLDKYRDRWDLLR